MALPLLSLMDDPELRGQFAGYLRDQQERLEAERDSEPEERVLAALKTLTQETSGSIPLHEIARRASADELGPPISSRDVGRVLRSRSIPLHKSHGTIVVPVASAN